MENKLTKQTQTQIVSALTIQGKALTKAYKEEQKLLKTKTTKMVFDLESFEYKLGKLISEILSLEKTKLISKELALKFGINAIDKRRRSEALWLFSNHSNVVTWLKNNPKKRFTSLPSLKNTYSFEHKPKLEETVKKEDITQIEDKSSEESNVGQSKEEPKAKEKLTASDVAFETVLALDTNGISKEEFLVALKEQLELIEDNTQLDEVA
tara:strand:- start:3 stop:632 length:630 start_codon:yes stop_codon:yes gene_type:complete